MEQLPRILPIACPHCGEEIFSEIKNIYIEDLRAELTKENILKIKDKKIRLTNTQAVMLRVLLLADGRLLTLDSLYGLIYSLKPECDWPDQQVIVVQMSKINRMLKNTGLKIQNVKGTGYYLRNVE